MRFHLTVGSIIGSLAAVKAFTPGPLIASGNGRYASNYMSKVTSLGMKDDLPDDCYDVVVIGSGIGGLSCAAMCALYGYR